MKVISFIKEYYLVLFFNGIIALCICAGLVYRHNSNVWPSELIKNSFQYYETNFFFSRDGHIVSDAYKEDRVFIPIEFIPLHIKNAFISAEDKRFYQHEGIDFIGLIRALLTNVMRLIQGDRLHGASTISQQLTKNIFLSPERTILRKIHQMILAMRLEKIFTKDEILEAYLNKVYLGKSAYGVASASRIYFSKDIKDVTLTEAAVLASLPQAPSYYSNNRDSLLRRRNWVLSMMYKNKYISEEEYKDSLERDFHVFLDNTNQRYVSSMQYYIDSSYKEIDQIYKRSIHDRSGLSIETSLDITIQNIISSVLKEEINRLSSEEVWNGPYGIFTSKDKCLDGLEEYTKNNPHFLKGFCVVSVKDDYFIALDSNQNTRKFTQFDFAMQKFLNQQKFSYLSNGEYKKISVGDLIIVDQRKNNLVYQQRNLNGAVVVLDSNTGSVLALTGGADYQESQFNRATQALRQPGSLVKPFLYSLAMERRYHPTDYLLDAPFVYEDNSGRIYIPRNYDKRYRGYVTLQEAFYKSLNLPIVRLADKIGMQFLCNFLVKTGVYNQDISCFYSTVLGSIETTLIQIVAAYAPFLNGGYKVSSSFIRRIRDSSGRVIYYNYPFICTDCVLKNVSNNEFLRDRNIKDLREKVISLRSSYLTHKMLQDVVQKGTARSLKNLHISSLAGKTGTTNNFQDAWFIGFVDSMIIGVYIGNDDNASLGRHKNGSTVALPVFKKIVQKMQERNLVKDEQNRQIFFDEESRSVYEEDANLDYFLENQ